MTAEVRDALSMWVVYDHPRDYPSAAFAARRWEIVRGGIIVTADMFTADTLEEVRALLPSGLHRMPRLAHDDVAILEVWL
jgi:hypothetical protein